MTNRASRRLLIAIVAIAGAFWWLLVDPDRGTAPAKPIHIAELRMLAGILPGQHPTQLTYTVLATRMTPGDSIAAGIGLKRRPLAIVAWTLPVPGKGPIIIDPGAPPPEARVGRFANFDAAKQNQIAAAAKTASLVLYTHGDERDLPRPAYRLWKAGISMASPTPSSATAPLSYTVAQAVAPGVVVIPASSHSPGARLIFVQLADGREFLFTGNIASFTENWARLRARSHLAAAWGPLQDRAQTYAWLRTIRQLRLEAPKLKIVPGHDYLWLISQQAAGAISELQPAPAPPPIARAAAPHHADRHHQDNLPQAILR
jgi:glyoxylase-like metal-dependent hydrolase (beta-lactamase superfamily II)